MMFSDAAVVGYGVKNPAANNLDEFINALKYGKRHLSVIENRPVPRNKRLIGKISDPNLPLTGRAFALASSVVSEALLKAGIDSKQDNVGLILATISGDTEAIEEAYQPIVEGSLSTRKLKTLTASFATGRLLAKLSKKFHLNGPQLVISNTCASSNVALGIALDYIRLNYCRKLVIVAVELCKLSTLWGADRAGILGTDLRPFDKERNGTIFGEGAAAMVIQQISDTPSEKILGYISGYGNACDEANAAIAFSLDGESLKKSMELALKDAKLNPSDVNYINAHSPGTMPIDQLECKAVYNLFCPRSDPIFINSTKSITSHLSGACSLTESIAVLLQMDHGFLHGNVGCGQVDPALVIKPLGEKSITAHVNYAISNSLGGGGLYTSLLIKSRQCQPALNMQLKSSEYYIIGKGELGASPWVSNDEFNFSSTANLGNEFDIYHYFPRETNYHYMNKAAQLGAASASLALQAANLNKLKADSDQISIIAGTCLGGAPEASELISRLLSTNPLLMTTNHSLDHGVNLGPALVGRYYQLTGTNYTITGSRLAGLQALSLATTIMEAERSSLALIMAFDSNTELQNKLMSRCTNKDISYANSASSLFIAKKGVLSNEERNPQVISLIAFRVDLESNYGKAEARKIFKGKWDSLNQFSFKRVYFAGPRYHKNSDFMLSILKLNFEKVLVNSEHNGDALASSAISAIIDASAYPDNSLIWSMDEYGLVSGAAIIGG